MKKLKLLLNGIFLLIHGVLSAQQDIQFTQYMDNTLAVNPAYAGASGRLNSTVIHREQWIGMDGRPRTTSFGLNSPLPYESVGIGFSAVNDVVGPIRQTMFFVDASYTFRFKNSKSKLAFGLKGGLNLLNSRTDQLQTTDSQDPNLMTNVNNQVLPNFGAGIYYHNPSFFVGVSTPKILEQNQGSSSTAKIQRHYFLIAGGVFNLTKNEKWKLRPTTQLKVTEGAPIALDISCAAIFSQKFWLGLTYRLQDSFGAFVQYQITPQFKAGIAYDQTITRLSGFNHGTYELLLSYDFVFKKNGIISPRYF